MVYRRNSKVAYLVTKKGGRAERRRDRRDAIVGLTQLKRKEDPRASRFPRGSSPRSTCLGGLGLEALGTGGRPIEQR